MTQIYPIKLGFVASYLITSENGIVLVDAGYPKKEKILFKFLESLNIDPIEIKLIVITHGHMDHVGSLKEIKEKTLAPVLIHESEGKLLKAGKSPEVKITISWLAKLIKPGKSLNVNPVEPDIMINGDFPLNDYGVDGKVICTPGHTEGSLSVIVDSKHAIVGDIAMKFPVLSRSSYVPIIAESIDDVFKSWQKILNEGAEIIYPAHGKIFKADVLRKLIDGQRYAKI